MKYQDQKALASSTNPVNKGDAVRKCAVAHHDGKLFAPRLLSKQPLKLHNTVKLSSDVQTCLRQKILQFLRFRADCS